VSAARASGLTDPERAADAAAANAKSFLAPLRREHRFWLPILIFSTTAEELFPPGFRPRPILTGVTPGAATIWKDLTPR
jgi:hypothetical protein